MTNLSTQPYKGTRDFYPEDMRLRNFMYDTWRKVCESFGYEETDSPVLEPLELYIAKTNEEIVTEQSYNFTDRGGRRVVMRPEMTPSISRMVAARRQELGYPLRVYNICNYFRYERPQKGRLREFWQLNADLFGIDSLEADIEMIQLADALMSAFGAKEGSYEIRLNSRKLLNKRIEEAGIKTSVEEVIRVIDRYDKQDRTVTLAQLAEHVTGAETLLNNLENDGSSEEVKQVTEKLATLGVKNIKPTETLARGFDYYTDIVFEVFDCNPDNNRSMFGGGRYDGLVGQFGVEPIPTVGFAMGDVTLQNFLETNKLIPELKSSTDIALITIGEVYEGANNLANELRLKSLNVSLDPTDRKLDKKIKNASKLGVRYALFVGEDELENQVYNLKNLQTGQEQKLKVEQIVSTVKD